MEKEFGWYFFIGLTALIIVIFAFWKNNFFFALFMIIAAILVMIFGSKRPTVHTFKIDGHGISIGNKFLPYSRISNFSIRNHPQRGGPREIVIRKKSAVNPFIHMPAEKYMISHAREILSEHIPEEDFNETFADIFADFLGF